MPSEYHWNPLDFLENWNDLYGEFCLAVSYSWIARGDPDPDGYHLQRLQHVVTQATSCVEVGDVEVGVFIDYLSLHQLPRQPQEEALFRKALASMDVIYGHYYISVLVMHGLPLHVRPRAAQRGWPLFEVSVACLMTKHLNSRIWKFDDAFVPTDGEDLELFNVDCRYFSEKPAPVTPHDFERLLEERVFTNGRTDRDVVQALYKGVFSTTSGEDSLDYPGVGANDEWVRRFLRTWPYWKHAKILWLNGNPGISDEGALLVSQMCARDQEERAVYMRRCGISAATQAECRNIAPITHFYFE